MPIIGQNTVMSHDFNLQVFFLITNVYVTLMNYEKPLYASLLPFKHFVNNTTNAIVLYNSVKQIVEFPIESEEKMLVPNKFGNAGRGIKCLTFAFFIFSVESFYVNIISDTPEVCFEVVTAVSSR
jgi:hypothetical protein